jgi:hypothetical protein
MMRIKKKLKTLTHRKKISIYSICNLSTLIKMNKKNCHGFANRLVICSAPKKLKKIIEKRELMFKKKDKAIDLFSSLQKVLICQKKSDILLQTIHHLINRK